MENIQQKADFLRHDFIKLLSQLPAAAPRQWGKMNVQQMIEHMSDYMRIANGRTQMKVIVSADRLPRVQHFLESEKAFQENTPNELMPMEPPPVRNATLQDAIDELKEEIAHFFEVHENDPGRTTPNPFFGNLNYEQQVQLLHKHATHHLRQFNVAI